LQRQAHRTAIRLAYAADERVIVGVALLMGTVFAMRMGWLEAGASGARPARDDRAGVVCAGNIRRQAGNRKCQRAGTDDAGKCAEQIYSRAIWIGENARVPRAACESTRMAKKFSVCHLRRQAPQKCAQERKTEDRFGIAAGERRRIVPDAAEAACCGEWSQISRAGTDAAGSGTSAAHVHISQEGAVQEIKLVEWRASPGGGGHRGSAAMAVQAADGERPRS